MLVKRLLTLKNTIVCLIGEVNFADFGQEPEGVRDASWMLS